MQYLYYLLIYLDLTGTSEPLCLLRHNLPVAEPLSVPPSEPSQKPLPASAGGPVQYGSPQWARQSFTKGFAGSDFVPQPDGTLRCPVGHPLSVQERRSERNGSLRIVYGARITHCRSCPQRELCQASPTTKKPRQVSAVLWPVETSPPIPATPALHPQTPSSESDGLLCAPHPVLWGDWPRSRLRRQWLRALHTQTVELTFRALPPGEALSPLSDEVQTRAQRAHYRLNWQQRLARNARHASAPSLEITIYGLPASLAQYMQCRFVTAA